MEQRGRGRWFHLGGTSPTAGLRALADVPMLQPMRRLGPTLLTLWAVVCLMAPPVAVVHEHDDGHEAHTHAAARISIVHIPLARSATDLAPRASRHAHPHAHPHPHPHVPSTPPADAADATDGCPEDTPSEPHAHVEDGTDAVSRARANAGPASDACAAGLQATVAAWRGAETVAPAGDRASRTHHAPPPDPGRALDVLISLGRLQV